MSRMKDLFIEAQDVACEYYNLDRRAFRRAIEKEFANHKFKPLMIQSAYMSYDEIQNDMHAYYEGDLPDVA